MRPGEPKFLTELDCHEKQDDSGAILDADFKYYSLIFGGIITVPAGFDTDFASVPRVLPIAYAFFGGTAKWAAVIHDYLYRACPLCVKRKDADAILYEAMGVCGIATWKRYCIWLGVRIGGSSSFVPYQSKGRTL